MTTTVGVEYEEELKALLTTGSSSILLLTKFRFVLAVVQVRAEVILLVFNTVEVTEIYEVAALA